MASVSVLLGSSRICLPKVTKNNSKTSDNIAGLRTKSQELSFLNT